MAKTRVPAIEGWFTLDEASPELIGARGVQSGSYFFPPSLAVSADPSASAEEREEVRLSRRGRIWSYTTSHYQPPAPYVSSDPFVPYTIVAVELEREKMVVLGALAAGVDPARLEVGAEVELELGPLYEDADHEYVIWQWRPLATA
jgi:uncharacterized OB-fold protein